MNNFKSLLIKASLIIAGLSFGTAQNVTNGPGAGSNANNCSGTYIGKYTGTVDHGCYNTFLGPRAGEKNNTGHRNLFAGVETGRYNTSGNYNVYLGYVTAKYNKSGYENIALGAHAAYKNQSGYRNVFVGGQTGYNNTTGRHNVFLGYQAGKANTSGIHNIFQGYRVGWNNKTGTRNVFLGDRAGERMINGHHNFFVGYLAGRYYTSGKYNVAFGYEAAALQSSGNNNIAIGFRSSKARTSGNDNVTIGSLSNETNTGGTRNVMIGHGAGRNSSGSYNIYIGSTGNVSSSNRLMIDNSSSTYPLIDGNFSSNKLTVNGKTGIDTYNFPSYVGSRNVSNYRLFVKGGVVTQALLVHSSSWADYVFEEGYNLKSLKEVEGYIEENGHLPNMPSAQEVSENGLEMAEITRLQQEKIEELTLYIIEQNKKIEALAETVDALKNK